MRRRWNKRNKNTKDADTKINLMIEFSYYEFKGHCVNSTKENIFYDGKSFSLFILFEYIDFSSLQWIIFVFIHLRFNHHQHQHCPWFTITNWFLFSFFSSFSFYYSVFHLYFLFFFLSQNTCTWCNWWVIELILHDKTIDDINSVAQFNRKYYFSSIL